MPVKTRLLLIVLTLGVCAHAQSIKPDDIVAAAIAHVFQDVQKFPKFVCDEKSNGVTYGPDGKKTAFSAGTYEWVVADGKLWGWKIDYRDGSRMRAFPPVDVKDVHIWYSAGVPMLELPTLFRVRSMRQSEPENRAVWVIALKARSNIEWPRRFAHYHAVQMWVDQQDGRLLKLVYTGTRQRYEVVFSTSHPGFPTEAHAESVYGSFLHRTRSISYFTYVYKDFSVSTRIALP